MGAIVVGYDGSAPARAALDHALALARELGDEVAVVFGYAPPGIWGGEIADHEQAIEELGERVTAEARGRAAAAGSEIEVELVPKRASEALLETAARREARMIVVGGSGDGAIKGILLGSTAIKLLHLSDRPLLVVPVN
jgi:nucleotide-binding universal stress UspA family protein